jgi:hypothetical protein
LRIGIGVTPFARDGAFRALRSRLGRVLGEVVTVLCRRAYVNEKIMRRENFFARLGVEDVNFRVTPTKKLSGLTPT